MSKRGENIYKRKDGRWEGRYIKCRTLQGKIQYGYVYGKSYSEAKAKLKENASTPIRASINQRSKKDMRVLSKKEQQQLECVLMQDTDLTKFMVLLCLYTGIRIGEACALRWEHLQLDSGILKVRETMQRIQAPQNITTKTKVIITGPKSACSKRDIPLPKFLIQYAAQFQAERKAFVLTGETDQFIEPRTLQNRFRNYVEASGIEHANYHALRHTFATRCVELGFEIKSLSEILGHYFVESNPKHLKHEVPPSFSIKGS